MRGVFDTNILIDYLSGVPAAKALLARYADPVISRITWIEVLVGCDAGPEEKAARLFLSGFRTIDVDGPVSEAACTIRRGLKKIRLPDALILATAQLEKCDLITRNTKDFPAGSPEVLVPYTLP